jgi:hypothetical protein
MFPEPVPALDKLSMRVDQEGDEELDLIVKLYDTNDVIIAFGAQMLEVCPAETVVCGIVQE